MTCFVYYVLNLLSVVILFLLIDIHLQGSDFEGDSQVLTVHLLEPRDTTVK